MLGLDKSRCPNKECKDFGKENHGNISIRGRYGKKRDKLLLYCKTCGKRFASSHGTPLFAAHLPKDKIHSIIHHISQGETIKSAAGLLGLPKATVKLTMDKVETFCLANVGEMMDALEMDMELMDELWLFLKNMREMRLLKNQKECLPEEEREAADDKTDCLESVDLEAHEEKKERLVSVDAAADE
ncbi:MAG: hypothetical protein LBE27_04175 [Deltaproteobacteria bacterium]|jgi:hypothetical protein|nr:hypothetical protein [Deltaproteobacteria bacterium]